MLQVLNILFWWAAAGVALFYLRKAALAAENAALAAAGAVAERRAEAARGAYGWGGVGPVTTTPLRPTGTDWEAEQARLIRETDWVAEQQKLLEEMARTRDNTAPARNAVDEELG